jgi:hypothetical protein
MCRARSYCAWRAVCCGLMQLHHHGRHSRVLHVAAAMQRSSSFRGNGKWLWHRSAQVSSTAGITCCSTHIVHRVLHVSAVSFLTLYICGAVEHHERWVASGAVHRRWSCQPSLFCMQCVDCYGLASQQSGFLWLCWCSTCGEDHFKMVLDVLCSVQRVR